MAEKEGLTPEAQEALSEAVRIVAEDKLFKAIHSHYTPPKPAEELPKEDPPKDPPPKSDPPPKGDPPPKADPPPPPKKEDPPPEEPKRGRGLWWPDTTEEE
jgi:hypothetical protein